MNVTSNGGLTTAGNEVIYLGGPAAGFSGTYHLIQYSGAIGGSGFAAFVLGTAADTPRGQVSSVTLVNDPGYVDVSVTVTPVVWTGSLSTAWNANDTLSAPYNWSYAGSGTNFQVGDDVQFDNSTASGGTVAINNGNVLPGGVAFNNDAAHPYTLTGLNGIGGSAVLVKNGVGTLTIANSNGYSGGTDLFSGLLVLNNNSAIGAGMLTINGGTLDSTVAGVSLPNNVQNWNGDFTFKGTQNLNLGTGAVTLGSSRTVTANANTLTVGGVISDGGNAYGLTKAGAGNLSLEAANTFTGPTIVNGGTLQLDYAGNIANGAWPRRRSRLTAAASWPSTSARPRLYRRPRSADHQRRHRFQYHGRRPRTFQNTVTMTGGTLSGPGAGDGNGVYSIDPQNGTDGFDATSDAAGKPAVINASSIGLQSADIPFNVTRGPANPPYDMVISSSIIEFGGDTHGIIQNGNGILVLTATGAVPVSGSSYTGNVTVNGGTLVAAAEAGGSNSVLGNVSNTRTVTVNAGAVLDFIAPNATATAFNSTYVPTLDISGGTVTNGEPGNGFPVGLVNNCAEQRQLDQRRVDRHHRPARPGYAPPGISMARSLRPAIR